MSITMDAVVQAKIGDSDYFEKLDLMVMETAMESQTFRSVLHLAVMYGHLSCCQVMYRRCPSLLYKKDHIGNSPLHRASYDGTDEIIKFLLTAKSSKLEQAAQGSKDKVDDELLMMLNHEKRTALHYAVLGGHVSSAKILIEADLSKKLVSMTDKYLQAPMHFAVTYKHLDIVKLLLKNIPSDFLMDADISGQTPLIMACDRASAGDSDAVEIRKTLIKEQPAHCQQPINGNDWTLIHVTAWNGYLSAVKDIIHFWPGCSELLNNEGHNFFHIAVSSGRFNIVEYVLELKHIEANVLNGKDLNGDTPLHFAMSNTSDARIALALLHESRVKKLVKNKDERSPLDVASFRVLNALRKDVFQFASKGDVDFFTGIQVDLFRNSRDENGETVLSIAVAEGHLNCCEMILERCKELLLQTNKSGMSSFHLAVSNGKYEILQLLLRRRGQNVVLQSPPSTCSYESILHTATVDKHETVLHLAVERGHFWSAQLVVRADPSCTLLEMTNVHGDTAMHIAVKGHHFEIVKLLLDAKPHLEYSTNRVGSTPLLIALQEASTGVRITVEIRNFLIQKQASQCRCIIGNKKWSLVHHATQKGYVTAIQEIADCYLDCLHLLDSEGYNILHLAAKFNQLSVVEYLTQLPNIDYLWNARDDDGNTPLHIAVSCGNKAVAQHLQADRRFINMPMNVNRQPHSLMEHKVPFKCAYNGDLDFFEIIPDDVLKISRDHDGASLLHVAVNRQHLNCCEVITKRCPELLYQKGQRGFYPLHLAIFHNDTDMVKLLINADPANKILSMTDDDNNTAMHHAVIKHHLDIVKLLVQADPNFEYSDNNSGKPPLFIAWEQAAASAGDQTIVEIKSYLMEKQSSQICKILIGEKKQTLLQYAISIPTPTPTRDLSAVEEIVKFCEDCLPLVDKDKQNVLHNAVSMEDAELVNYILNIKGKSDSLLNARDSNGNTPLHLATANRSVNIALSLLYDDRVQKLVPNKKGKNALEKIDFAYDLSRAKVEGLPGLVDIKVLKDQSEYDLLVGALISTVSFTAGVTIPGGFFADGPYRGGAVLYKKRTFKAFVVFNALALALSLFVVFSHFCLRRLISKKNIVRQLRMASLSLIGAIFAMLLAFIMGTFAVLSISIVLSIIVGVICGCSFGGSIWCLLMTIGEKEKKRGQNLQPVMCLWYWVVSKISYR